MRTHRAVLLLVKSFAVSGVPLADRYFFSSVGVGGTVWA
jgi:hypothetical protein